MAETVHIAGPDILIGDRWLRQRCSWCGYILLDYDLALIAVPEGQDPTPATWERGGLVLVDGAMKTTVDQPEDGRLPASSCVTRELDAAALAEMEAAMGGS